MKHINNKIIFAALFLLTIGLSAEAQLKYMKDVKTLPPHPRILLFAGEEQQIKDNVASDPVWAKVNEAIMKEANAMIDLPVLERIKTGKRLLSVSREALRRIFYLSYSYRMTGEAKYMQRAEKEMLAVSAFNDWNPSHFLDVGEMTMALAIGYDWLYDKIAPSTRSQVRDAILKNGLDASLNVKSAWFLNADHNWNQVCNGGMTYGALAIFEEMPELCKMIIDRAIETIHLPMKMYQPDGAYPEGYGYWGYGTTFNILFLSAIEKVFNTDFGLIESAPFLKTAYYEENMIGPQALSFNYADNGVNGGLHPCMFWFAARLNDPSVLYFDKQFLDRDIRGRDRILPAILIWGRGLKLTDVKAPTNNIWVGQGMTPVALMRTSWTDPNAIFVGFKGGTAASNHAHMDGGSFVMDANGVRWASDFGGENYNSLETKGVDLWNRAQNSQRWQVFRYNNMAHNTLTVDNKLHNVMGYADISSWSDAPAFISAQADISHYFDGSLSSAKRGIAIVDGKYVVVRDELKTLDKETTIRWTLLTTTTAKMKGKNKFELNKDGKKLKLEVVEPAKVTLKTWSTVSPNSYDTANPGTTLIGFEVTLPANSTTALTVKLIPQTAKKTTAVKPLSEWPANHKNTATPPVVPPVGTR